VPAVGAARPRKAVGEDAAFEVAAEFSLGYGYRRSDSPGALILKRQPGAKMRLRSVSMTLRHLSV